MLIYTYAIKRVMDCILRRRFLLPTLTLIGLLIMCVNFSPLAPTIPRSSAPFHHRVTNKRGDNFKPPSRHALVSNCPALPGTTNMTICPGDVIPEHVALNFPPCTDHKLAADANMSKIDIQAPGNGTRYIQGDIISLTVVLYDGYGRRKTSGGDLLRCRMVADNGASAVTGTVFDHENGSYTIHVEALFAGKATFEVRLAYTRETITAYYRMLTKTAGLARFYAQFVNENIHESTMCHTFKERLPNNSYVCNFTFENSGMPWYCGRPEHVDLQCEDWEHIRQDTETSAPYLNQPEKQLVQQLMQKIPNYITIDVEQIHKSPQSFVEQLVACDQYNTTDLWFTRNTSGFMYRGQWKLRHCSVPAKRNFTNCLRNRRILLAGDSTVRQWFSNIMARFGCSLTTQTWTRPQWHKLSACTNRELNFSAVWQLHSLPFSDESQWTKASYTSFSISRRIDEDIRDDEDVIILIHVFLHMVGFRHDVFQTKVRRIRESVERLLRRNDKARVFIKGPHTFLSSWKNLASTIDYAVYLYRNIWFQEFFGLHERVVYLDNKDITDATANHMIHPSESIVTAMVNTMLGYMCE